MKAGSTIVEAASFFLDLYKTISQVVIQITSENIVHVVVEDVPSRMLAGAESFTLLAYIIPKQCT